jgi:hypothetical protein
MQKVDSDNGEKVKQAARTAVSMTGCVVFPCLAPWHHIGITYCNSDV